MPQDLLTSFAILMRAADFGNTSELCFEEEIEPSNEEEILLRGFRGIHDVTVKEAILAVICSIVKRSASVLS